MYLSSLINKETDKLLSECSVWFPSVSVIPDRTDKHLLLQVGVVESGLVALLQNLDTKPLILIDFYAENGDIYTEYQNTKWTNDLCIKNGVTPGRLALLTPCFRGLGACEAIYYKRTKYAHTLQCLGTLYPNDRGKPSNSLRYCHAMSFE